MLSVGRVGVTPLTQTNGHVAFGQSKNDDPAREELKQLEEMTKSNSELIKKGAGIALLIGTGFAGYAAFQKALPEAGKYLKNLLDKSVPAPKQQKVIKAAKKGAKSLAEAIIKTDAKLLKKVESLNVKKGSFQEKAINFSLKARNEVIQVVNHVKDWSQKGAKNSIKEVLSVLAGGTAGIEVKQELDQAMAEKEGK